MIKITNFKNSLMNSKLELKPIADISNVADLKAFIGVKANEKAELSLNKQWLTGKNRDRFAKIIEAAAGWLVVKTNLLWPMDDKKLHFELSTNWVSKKSVVVEMDKADKDVLAKLVAKYGKASLNRELRKAE